MSPEHNRLGPDEHTGGIFRFLMVIPVPLVFVLAYILGVCIEFLFFGRASAPGSDALNLAGNIVFGLGAVIAGWGWFLFHRAGTTRIPGETSTTLVTWGPYRITRNPMYIGLSVAYLGEACLLRQVWPVAFLPLVIAYLNWIVIPVEEGKLQDAFGDQFQRYRSQVRRWL